MTRTSTSTSNTTAAPATAAYDELFEQWQRTSTKRRATTIVEYRKVFDSFAVFVEHKPLAEIERRDVLAFRDHVLAAGQR